jgi:hypothetical protein
MNLHCIHHGKILLLLIAALLYLASGKAHSEPVCCSDQPSWAERNYHQVNKGFHATAAWLDRFFADERFEEEHAWTRLKLSWTFSKAEHEDLDNDLRLRGKVVLPNLNRRWQLVFEGDPEKGDITGLNDDEESTTALRYILKENLKRRVSFDVGAAGGFSDPRVYTRAQYRLQREDEELLWRLRPTIFWDSRDSWRAFVQYDNEQRLNNHLYFRSSTTPGWRKDTPGWQLTQNFTIYKELSSRRYLALDWLNSFVSQPAAKLDSSRVRLRFRREIWQDKLFVEVGPGVRFLDENQHRAEAEGYLRFELLFEQLPETQFPAISGPSIEETEVEEVTSDYTDTPPSLHEPRIEASEEFETP